MKKQFLLSLAIALTFISTSHALAIIPSWKTIKHISTGISAITFIYRIIDGHRTGLQYGELITGHDSRNEAIISALVLSPLWMDSMKDLAISILDRKWHLVFKSALRDYMTSHTNKKESSS